MSEASSIMPGLFVKFVVAARRIRTVLNLVLSASAGNTALYLGGYGGKELPFPSSGVGFPAVLPAQFGDDLGVKAGIDWEGVIICPAAHLYS